ncbi:MAG: 23S rRNA (adenine(2030)-N(6))-methyltransferase RlmJ [Mariprofundaceae bacterium]|nr:23S rRNA (adenine(2030)-N(6))-methyltransferase RlmJ [Mariprofundaceae bacterium]
MLSYQHSYHAGNFADVHKHSVLLLLLRALQAKEKPFFVLDAFAGRGLYQLGDAEAEKTGEYLQGIGRIWQKPSLPDSMSDYMQAVRNVNSDLKLKQYPGSPLLIRSMIREQDRMAVCELHPAEFDALRQILYSEKRVALHKRDAVGGMKAMLPPKERRGLLLLDPAYEVKQEYESVPAAVVDAYRHWREGIYAIWYPLLTAGNHEKLRASLKRSGIRKMLDSQLMVDTPESGGMYGSGMIIINPPWRLKDQLEELLPWLAARLAGSGSAPSGVRWLVPE